MSRVMLIDATNNFVRNYVVVPTLSLNGEPIGAVEGFLKSLRSFIEKCKPDKVVVIWDGPGGSKKRRAVVKEYKEGRKPYRLNRNYDFEHVNEADNKIFQRVRLDDYLQDLPVIQVMIEDIEADDSIAYISNHLKDDQKIIVSTDKDFLQLLDKNTIIYHPIKKVFVTSKECKRVYNVYPQNFAIVRAIVGDKSDNLKGVKSVGMKNVLKYFPFLTEERTVELDEIFKYAEANDEKYKKFLDAREVIINNHQLMQLRNTIISFQNIHKIKEALETKPSLLMHSFRVKLLKDGLTTIGDSFFSSFKTLTVS